MNSGSPSSTSDSLSYREKERLERRRRILLAAEKIFSAYGYHEASITEIAKLSEFATGTIYLYFKDKADLYGHLVLEKIQQMVSRHEEALTSSPSTREAIRAGVHAQFAFHDANRPFFEIFLYQSQLQSSPLHESHWLELERLKKRNLTTVTECIARGQERGELKSGDPHLYAVAYLGVTLQMIRQWIREKGDGQLRDRADFAADCFLNGSATPSP
jgi:TetR/AcrR family fatty acid metabolism transcriptional regulator